MAESILFYDPQAFTAYQNCACGRSRMIDDVAFKQSEVVGDKITMTVTLRPKVCSVCGNPYRVTVDTQRVGMIVNAEVYPAQQLTDKS